MNIFFPGIVMINLVFTNQHGYPPWVCNRLWTLICNVRLMKARYPTRWPFFCVLALSLENQDPGTSLLGWNMPERGRLSGWGENVSRSTFRVSCSAFRVSCSAFRVSYLRVWSLNFEIWRVKTLCNKELFYIFFYIPELKPCATISVILRHWHKKIP